MVICSKTIYYRTIAIEVYGCKMYCECVGLKHPKQELEGLFKHIQTMFKEMLTILL